MKEKIQQLHQSKFVRNVAIVATGTAGAQAISLAFSPIITRLYGPEAFGILGTFIAILALIAPLAALSYPIAIVLPREDADAILLARFSLWIALFTSLLTALILICFKAPIVQAFKLHSVESFILLLPFAMFFSVCLEVVSQWVVRKNLFKIKARVAILQTLLINITKMGLGLVNPVAAMLVIVGTFSGLIHAAMLWADIRKKSGADTTSTSIVLGSGDRHLLRTYKDFALLRTPQVFINSIGQNLPILMLASFFGPAVVGFYALSRTVLGVPSTLIGQSVADVFYPKFVETVHSGGNGKRLLIKACASLMAVGFIPYLIVIVFGPWLFSLVFGAEWQMAGEFARWMSIWLFVVLVTRPIISAIPVLSLQGSFLVYEVIALLVRGVAIYAGYFLADSALGAVIAFSLSNVLIYAVLAGFVIHKS